MNAIRSRIERIEETLGRSDATTEKERSQLFASQLQELSDAELDRLEAIFRELGADENDDDRVPIPVGCEHVRDFVTFVDADPQAYFRAAREQGS